MTSTLRWTSADLEALPHDGKRYEIIGGDLYVSRQPSWQHQYASGEVYASLQTWSRRSCRALPARWINCSSRRPRHCRCHAVERAPPAPRLPVRPAGSDGRTDDILDPAHLSPPGISLPRLTRPGR